MKNRLLLLSVLGLGLSLVAVDRRDLAVGQAIANIETNLRWPEFRGSNGNGLSRGTQLPLEWSESENVQWKTAIPGKGWSSPVVWDNQIWMTTATEDGKQMFAVCVDRTTGNIVHHLKVLENQSPRFCHPTNSYASPTPAIEEGRIYLHFGSYGTMCLDTETGNKLWQRLDFECDHWRGPASSPILFGSALYVAFDGFDQQYVVALDKQTGETVWKTDRNIKYASNNGDHKKAYATAQVIEVDGQAQLVWPSAAETIAYEPRTGEELWRVYHGGMNAATRPVFAHGLVYLTNGDSTGKVKSSLLAVRPERELGIDSRDDLSDGRGSGERRIVWRFDRSAPKRPSPLIIGDLLFAISDDGIAFCLDARTGEEKWRKRVGGKFRASPLAAGNRIYLCSLEGNTTVIAAEAEFRVLASNQLDDGFQASPVPVGEALLLRSIKNLYLIGP